MRYFQGQVIGGVVMVQGEWSEIWSRQLDRYQRGVYDGVRRGTSFYLEQRRCV